MTTRMSLELRTFDAKQVLGALPGDHRAEHDEGAYRTDQHDLADREARDQPFAHGVVQGEHEVAAEHEQYPGKDEIFRGREPSVNDDRAHDFASRLFRPRRVSCRRAA